MGERTKTVSIQFNILLPAVITKKAKWYSSYCPDLDVTSQGATEEEAKETCLKLYLHF